MKNTKIALRPETGNKFRIVIWGDNDVWGEARGMLLLPEQPRRGQSRETCLALAANWPVERVNSFADSRVGSYVTDEVASSLEVLQPTTMSQTVHVQQIATTVDQAADLIAKRRGALKEIAEIDRRLEALIGAEHAMVISEGMSRPLPMRN